MPLIALIGLPGCGKTTVGRQVARRLGLRFVDSDAVIEEALGESIRSFFDREGEACFRDVEETTIATLTVHDGIVLATGGGAVLRPANRAVLKRSATVVYLRSRPEELGRRLRHDTKRPLLQGVDPVRRLRELYAVRDPLYMETAHYVVEIGRPSLPALVNVLLMQLELGCAEGDWLPAPLVPSAEESVSAGSIEAIKSAGATASTGAPESTESNESKSSTTSAMHCALPAVDGPDAPRLSSER